MTNACTRRDATINCLKSPNRPSDILTLTRFKSFRLIAKSGPLAPPPPTPQIRGVAPPQNAPHWSAMACPSPGGLVSPPAKTPSPNERLRMMSKDASTGGIAPPPITGFGPAHFHEVWHPVRVQSQISSEQFTFQASHPSSFGLLSARTSLLAVSRTDECAIVGTFVPFRGVLKPPEVRGGWKRAASTFNKVDKRES